MNESINDTTQPKPRTRSEEKRQQIVQAASHLFTEQGYLSTSMDQVAEAAGVSKQTVYSHFGAKEDLFKFCVEERCIANVMNEQVFSGSRPIRDTLLDFARHFQELIMSREAIQLCRLCAANAELHPEISAMFFAAGPEQVEAALKHYLAGKVDAGELACDDLDMACEQLLSLLKTGTHFMAILGLPHDESQNKAEQYLHKSVDMFLRYYQS
ncbi:TetR family transcriptional regulator [Simiduia agarivorans SA1 = DSM 21679]|uniref:TetR family transcriptional regulator n=2 Tax=Simiduia TaxID=447467 RepID=K4KN46_SIMAS|nr:TetR family transcriptional regulator [Simiduia agarivorans SA1 = DSM 21679]